MKKIVALLTLLTACSSGGIGSFSPDDTNQNSSAGSSSKPESDGSGGRKTETENQSGGSENGSGGSESSSGGNTASTGGESAGPIDCAIPCGGTHPYCDTTKSECGECLADFHCVYTFGETHCELSTNECYECTADEHCDGACVNHECVECSNNSHCSGDKPVCDTSQNKCVGCLNDSNCSGETPICNQEGKKCGVCNQDSDCHQYELNRCRADGVCAECLSGDTRACWSTNCIGEQRCSGQQVFSGPCYYPIDNTRDGMCSGVGEEGCPGTWGEMCFDNTCSWPTAGKMCSGCPVGEFICPGQGLTCKSSCN